MSTLGPLDPSGQASEAAVLDGHGALRRVHLEAGTSVSRYVVQ